MKHFNQMALNLLVHLLKAFSKFMFLPFVFSIFESDRKTFPHTGLNINFIDNYCITLGSRKDIKKCTTLLP